MNPTIFNTRFAQVFSLFLALNEHILKHELLALPIGKFLAVAFSRPLLVVLIEGLPIIKRCAIQKSLSAPACDEIELSDQNTTTKLGQLPGTPGHKLPSAPPLAQGPGTCPTRPHSEGFVSRVLTCFCQNVCQRRHMIKWWVMPFNRSREVKKLSKINDFKSKPHMVSF